LGESLEPLAIDQLSVIVMQAWMGLMLASDSIFFAPLESSAVGSLANYMRQLPFGSKIHQAVWHRHG
jgi:hypothetical protein